ncbi:LuxR C-terminal-related transcriptional regulator [Longivirga aurantiaca]|uniref:LuxR C-terminal-related transcriptional regulator n=1 Tax=Longivirga aurantiaca TaxID=1837743 RepID=A0ABW1SYN8_9ACTN
MTATDDREEARAALKAGRWAEAVDRFTVLAAMTGDPEGFEGIAEAAWWLDDAGTCLEAREAAYRSFRATGDDRGAARAAASLGYDSMLFGRGVAVGRGWLARAADLLAGATDVPEAGWLAVRQAEVALNVDHDSAAALDAAARASAVGRATGDDDLAIVGQALEGLAHVRCGDVVPGMAALDSAAAAATAGDVESLMWMGKICCWLISACQETHDLARAGDWCARVEDICVRHELAPLFAVCRTQYATVQLASGDSAGAESTLVDVMSRLERSQRMSRLDAVAQLGEVRRRQGRLIEAEALLAQAGYLPAAVTSLARLRLDQGDAARAWSTIAELLRSMRGDELLERVGALDVAVAAGIAAGNLAEAQQAAAELRRIADRVGTVALAAHADSSEARLADDDAAIEKWEDAVRRFHLAGRPFDEADARLQLAAALRRTDDVRADEQQRAAMAILGPLRSTPADGPLTERQTEVLRLLAAGLSNAEIARQLHLSEHTVHRHIANIYAALDVGSRVAAATYATDHGLTEGSR